MNRHALALTIAAVLAVAPAACHRSGGDGSGTGAITPDSAQLVSDHGGHHARARPRDRERHHDLRVVSRRHQHQLQAVRLRRLPRPRADGDRSAPHSPRPTITTTSGACYSCHMTGAPVAFSHTGITTGCAQCHDVGNPFAALPVPGFTHPPTNGADCSDCHGTKTWNDAAGGAPNDSHDPARDLVVDALIPTYTGTSIASLSPQTEILPQIMNHATTALDAAALSACRNCHPKSNASVFYPGVLHASLDVLQVAAADGVHRLPRGDSMPTGFVGPIDDQPHPRLRRDEARRRAVERRRADHHGGGGGRVRPLPPRARARVDAPGRSDRRGRCPAVFHPSADRPRAALKPTSCLDCHANSRPAGATARDAQRTASRSAAKAWSSTTVARRRWATAAAATPTRRRCTAPRGRAVKFHPSGSATPKTCLPCHAGERPTSTTGWTSRRYIEVAVRLRDQRSRRHARRRARLRRLPQRSGHGRLGSQPELGRAALRARSRHGRRPRLASPAT